MTMKEIRAIVRPSRLERLRTELRAIPNFPGVTIFKAEGFTAPRQWTSVRSRMS
jgi:nitrogen regulatory protein P-II 1